MKSYYEISNYSDELVLEFERQTEAEDKNCSRLIL